ncbi:MAG: GH92 family glycosyl hydrolase, partial [Paramuribaculum sp.]|nr:GH92 family glycosyl hydrolase [Paramuribaculum sp.]
YVDYVDTKIGPDFHGHVFVGADVPFGMVQLGPTSIPQSWDWCSGYHDSDSTVIGFSHTHLSGTGIGDLFDVTLMPVTGEVTYARGQEENPGSGLWSYADRSKEVSVPGYYSVPLTRYGINAELTATNRTGLHRYTFPKSDSAAIVIDLQNGGCWDKATDVAMTVEGDNRIVGQRFSKGWANNQKVFFVAEFSKPFESFELKGDGNLFGRANFVTDSAEQILVKVALSPVSIEGAKANMAKEMPGWDFEATRLAATDAWNSELGKVTLTTSDDDARKIFYTSLYHTMISPATFSDVDGKYRGADDKIHQSEQNQYTVYSLWDTYRAQMPLMALLHPERNAEMINNMVNIAEEQGRLPVWHLWGNETNCMV